MIQYGSPEWAAKTGKATQEAKINATGSRALLKIPEGLRTVSNQVLNIVTNIMPISHTIERENELFVMAKQTV